MRPIVNPNTTIIQQSPVILKEIDKSEVKDPAKNRAKKLLKLEDIGKINFSTLFWNNPSLIF